MIAGMILAMTSLIIVAWLLGNGLSQTRKFRPSRYCNYCGFIHQHPWRGCLGSARR
jgi:hypothetical protein